MTNIRSLYKPDVDFAALASQSPPFNQFLKSNGQLDFSDPHAVQQLTKSLLKRDFDLELELPDDRLCPPVPNRLSYIFWVQDLLDTTSRGFSDSYDPNREVMGLDIGTGSSCIYPLLGCVQRPNWKFVATDIDQKNIEFAHQNILQNNLKSRIRCLLTKPHSPLIPLDTLGLRSIDFTICNPPFYASQSDLLASANFKSRPPHSACTGADVEMVTPGGEVAFVTRMIIESAVLKHRCQWYTSMLGKLHSSTVLVEKLRAVGVKNWAVTEFVQGQKTRRWAIAWSWGALRPTQHLSRGIPSVPKSCLPFPSTFTFLIPTSTSTVTAAAAHLNSIFNTLDLRWQYRAPIASGLGFAAANVWSRAARRHGKKRENMHVRREGMNDDIGEEEGSYDDEPALGFKISLAEVSFQPGTQSHFSDESSNLVEVTVRWVFGNDSILFESLCGMLKRETAGAGSKIESV